MVSDQPFMIRNKQAACRMVTVKNAYTSLLRKWLLGQSPDLRTITHLVIIKWQVLNYYTVYMVTVDGDDIHISKVSKQGIREFWTTDYC